MLCPACAVEMNQEQRRGAAVNVCPGCGACWATRGIMHAAIEGIERRFDAAVLAALRAECAERRRAALTAPAMSGVVYRKCPDCGAQMHRKAFAPLSGMLGRWLAEALRARYHVWDVAPGEPRIQVNPV